MKKFPDLFLMILILASSFMISFSTKEKNIIENKNKSENVKFNNKNIPDSLFHSGDLIFRDGRGFISSAFRKLSLTDPHYSHAGIIHRENGKIFVYHLIGGEGQQNKMRKDLLENFCSSLQANSFAIYRSDQNGEQIDSLAKYFFSKEIEFDSGFSLMTNDKMYCTELLYKILVKVSGQDNFLSLTTLSGIKYVSCDNIYLSPHMKKIYAIDYSF